nr:hypothetical protein [Ruegeria atlantica]
MTRDFVFRAFDVGKLLCSVVSIKVTGVENRDGQTRVGQFMCHSQTSGTCTDNAQVYVKPSRNVGGVCLVHHEDVRPKVI